MIISIGSSRKQTKSTHKNPSPSVGSFKGFKLHHDAGVEEVYKSDENGGETDDTSSGGDSKCDGDL